MGVSRETGDNRSSLVHPGKFHRGQMRQVVCHVPSALSRLWDYVSFPFAAALPWVGVPPSGGLGPRNRLKAGLQLVLIPFGIMDYGIADRAGGYPISRRVCVKLASAMQSIRGNGRFGERPASKPGRRQKTTDAAREAEGFTRSRQFADTRPRESLGRPPSSCETNSGRLLLLIPMGERMALPGADSTGMGHPYRNGA